jgi:hypothetical protein
MAQPKIITYTKKPKAQKGKAIWKDASGRWHINGMGLIRTPFKPKRGGWSHTFVKNGKRVTVFS